MALIQMNFLSECLMRTVTVQVMVPFDKIPMPGQPKKSNQKFKALYLLHGIFGNYTDWISNTCIQRWAEEKNLALVMPSGENHFYVDCAANGERYGEFIGRELPDKMRELFPLSDSREDTYIAGLSMGGYGAIINGLKYHKNFSRIAALSSALILDVIGNGDSEDLGRKIFGPNFYNTVMGDLSELKGSEKDCEALVLKLKEDNIDIPELYLCCGTEDMLFEKSKKLADFLQQEKVACTFEEGPGNHDWNFWNEYIQKVLVWLPLQENSKGIHSGNIGTPEKI